MTVIPMPQMSLAYWVERARAELEDGKTTSARGSMRRALEDHTDTVGVPHGR